jgi:hypothetical protein
MCQTVEDLKAKANWDGAEGESRHLLLSDLSRTSTFNLRQSFQLTLFRMHFTICHVTRAPTGRTTNASKTEPDIKLPLSQYGRVAVLVPGPSL